MSVILDLTKAQGLKGQLGEWAYNAVDCLSTREISHVLDNRMKPEHHRAHDFYMALQGPAVEMTIRGMRVDESARQALVDELKKEIKGVNKALQALVMPTWDVFEKETGVCLKSTRKDNKHSWAKGEADTPERKCTACGQSRMKVRAFNPNSDPDLMNLFYNKLAMKPIRNKDGNVTANKEARDRLKDKYPKHEEIIGLVNQHADLKKQLEFLAFKQSSDGRFKASFNVGVTNTSRWSSNKNPFGEGANAQNVTERHRHIFIADPGMELCYADLRQAESNIIAHEAGDEAYIEAHEMGDTHTYVTRLIYPEGINGDEWTGDIEKDGKIAKSHRPTWDDREGHDYRFQSKAIQHGSNLGLTPFGMAIQKRIPLHAAKDGQARYFRAFPGIRAYQADIRRHVEEQLPIMNALGISFKLFGRPWDEHTVKQGLAIKPQSTVGHVIAIGVYRIWRELAEVQLLAQVHDAILFQFPKGRYELVERALELMTVPLPIKGVDGKWRTTTIGTEAAVGLNWGHVGWDKKAQKETNPNGLREISFKPDHTWSIKH